MKVYFITNSSFPEGGAPINRIKCLSKAFEIQGVDCEIILYGCHHIQKDIPTVGIIDGLKYRFMGKSIRRIKNNYLGRIQSLFKKNFLIYFLLRYLENGDYVYAYLGKGNFLRKVILTVVHLKKSFYISELCEYPYASEYSDASTERKRSYLLKKIFPHYDGVVAISDTLVQLAQKYCRDTCIIIKVPILVEYEKYNLTDGSADAEFQYIFHSGSLYEEKDGILGMLEAFGKATLQLDRKIHFVLTGNPAKSPHWKEIQLLINKYEINDLVHFTGFLAEDELKSKLSQASLVIINKYPTRQNKYCFSTKLGEYMAAGKPIIITRVGEAINWLKDGYDSVMVDTQNLPELTEAIIRLFNDEQLRKQIGKNAKITCRESFDYSKYSSNLNDFLLNVKN